jgi:hypothetical protein
VISAAWLVPPFRQWQFSRHWPAAPARTLIGELLKNSIKPDGRDGKEKSILGGARRAGAAFALWSAFET